MVTWSRGHSYCPTIGNISNFTSSLWLENVCRTPLLGHVCWIQLYKMPTVTSLPPDPGQCHRPYSHYWSSPSEDTPILSHWLLIILTRLMPDLPTICHGPTNNYFFSTDIIRHSVNPRAMWQRGVFFCLYSSEVGTLKHLTRAEHSCCSPPLLDMLMSGSRSHLESVASCKQQVWLRASVSS